MNEIKFIITISNEISFEFYKEGENMKVNKEALYLAMARACLNRRELAEKAGIPESTLQGVINRRGVRPATLGKVARALGIDPLEIIEQEE